MIDYGKTKVKDLPVLISDKSIYCEGGGRLLSDIIYPIGSIYLSVVNTNPSVWFGGKWEAFATGKTLVGIDTSQTEFNTVLKTGGEKTHQLTVPEMPSHKHDIYTAQGGSWARETVCCGNTTDRSALDYNNNSYVGGNQAHNNLQPYIVVYMWRRIS